MHGVRNRGIQTTRRNQRNQTVDGTNQGRVAQDFLRGGRRFASEKVLFFEVGTDGINTQRTGNQRNANRRKRRGGRDVAQGEENDTGNQDGGRQPFLPAVLLTDDQDGGRHDWDNLGGLKDDSRRVVQVGQGVVGQGHAAVRVDGQDAVVLPRTFSRVVRELHFQSTAQKVRERGQHGHPRGKLKARDAEDAFLQGGEAQRGAERARGENQKGQSFVFRQVEAKDLLLFPRSGFRDTSGLTVCIT